MKRIILIFLLVSYPAFVTAQVSGCFVSKRSKFDMFITKIQLNEDGTFKYEFSGDLAHNWGDGNYSIDTDQVVILNFGESDLDSQQELIQSLSGGKKVFGIMFFVLKKSKLYPLKENGRVDRKIYLKELEINKCTWRK